MDEQSRSVKVSGPLSGGRGRIFGSPLDVERRGCVIAEFLLEGTAVSYAPVPGTAVGTDGIWSIEPSVAAPYRTRMYVVRPADAARFNGVVLVNWQNVTAGVDLGAPTLHDMESGYVWVGVTAQRVAVDGQPSLTEGLPSTEGLRTWDPDRYGTLDHPGDAFSYDIYTQAARAVGPNRAREGVDPLGGLEPRLMIATGGSQSAMRLGSYINIADRFDRVFDGFYLTVHWGMCPYPPDQPLVSSFAPAGDGLFAGSAEINDRGRVPVLVLNSESETMHVFPVRQPDSDTFRFWEMAGTAHAGGGASEDMDEIMLEDGMQPFLSREAVNTVDWSFVRNAALEHVVAWAAGGAPPGSFPPIDVAAAPEPAIVRDALGNATGGIRLPELAVPAAVHSGTNTINPLAALSGQSTPLTVDQLTALYDDAESYVKAWVTAVDDLAAQGLVLDKDRAGVLARGRATAEELWGATREQSLE